MCRSEVFGIRHDAVAQGNRERIDRGGGGIMRYFLLIFAVCVAVVVGIAGKRGTLSRKTPLYVFPDMRRQLKLRPQEANGFFANGVSSQLPVPGTVAQSKPMN